MSALFSPLTIKEITLPNRIAVSPMCEYSSVDGFANDWHLVHLGSRAVGGAGLIIMEATAVVPEGRITPADMGIWKDEHIPFLQRITSFIHSQGSIAGIQIAHAGRKASKREPWNKDEVVPDTEGGWQTVAPSAIPFNPNYDTPRALDIEDIEKLIEDFRLAASRAVAAGFKVLEIHAAHGYLLHEFYSPLSNQRTDEYGGSFENRTRLLLNIVEAVKTVWPAGYPLFVRISATDWVEGGWTIEDSVVLAGKLKKRGVDLIDCSTGGNVTNVKIPLVPGYQVPFAARIKEASGIATGAVGLITTAEQAEEIISSGKADLVLLAREFLSNPYFPLHAARQLGVDVKWPQQYERAKPK
ncbi:NADPH dehydrogenase NamA [Segetibacter sp. 3557_3]|uniref:NADPH dehydrogenase NamA n=1 Tax=Segetibacter sp. 3557_3 TaxID=2547429 RepID=UPI001058AE7B|nr:NADPH dehydrogenase NamA [Segetibacter sp. 3557_3]TDH28756.1 NADPH dehydrogenase NamA [Segetibacter sp. 3557_3]